MKKLLVMLSPGERRRGLMVLGMVFLLAVFETAGVASVMPFLAVLGNPDMVQDNPYLAFVFERGGFTSVDRFLFALGLAAFLIIVFSSVFRIASIYVMNRFTQMRRYSIGARLLQVYLRQPYEFFLGRNSADLSKSILSEVDILVSKVFKPGLDLIAYGMLIIILIGFLVILDPMVAVSVIFFVGGAYLSIYFSIQGLLGRMGRDRVAANRERFTAASEAFGGIKDLKLLGREQGYLKRFRDPALRYARHHSVSATVSAAPKHVIEALGFGGVLVLILVLSVRANLADVLPLLGTYTLAGYKLLPAAQRVFASVSSLRFGWPAVDGVYEDLTSKSQGESLSRRQRVHTEAMRLQSEMRFERVSFRYPGADEYALNDLDLRICARTSVAFVGETGAGKTTAVDLVLGLLRPSQGQILVDGNPLTRENVRLWQRSIGYVPQTIYLADASVSENIAFGLDPDEIDHDAVEKAARIANIHEFIEESLPLSYSTEVGERGVRLSGGQVQRIGIARALYHDPDLLVLDEATSALDTATERSILASVSRLTAEKTIITIAHRMSTVEHCDQIIVLCDGRIEGIGSFEKLKKTNPAFRRLTVVS